ncbi:hypothetical protein [Microbacterium sp. H1-D42]|uniref:hypothetical protein n=1 Tax=Microbacterium sp. H1-D42 TaxID=2925844 RepID=UPI001F53D914|nr:hypothetical protein [Microbacterium sp. H1-D42]UNK70697.1 hypothetical protein MNR00_16315 [Microbacterium sp. H1-D42]
MAAVVRRGERAPRVAFAGAAHSHAFSDARNLRALGAEIIGLWDVDDPSRAADFCAEFEVSAVADRDRLFTEADLIVSTVRTPRAAELALVVAESRTPAFFNKTVASTPAAYAEWTAAGSAPRFTSSVLRFAPKLVALAEQIAGGQLRTLDVRVQHSIAALLEPRSWQDELTGAGGTLVNFGVHAWEMVDVLLPGGRAEILDGSAAREGLPTASEAHGTVRARIGTVEVNVSVSGVDGTDVYAVRAVTDRGVRVVELAPGAAELGYHGAADAMLELARGGTPAVSAARTAAVYANVFAAAQTARRSLC